MPETMSQERQKLLKALGATLELTPGADGMNGAIRRANELKELPPGSFIPQQFDNPTNPQAHISTTAEEIWRDTDGEIDMFVAGVGTGGTLSGTAKGLKNHNPLIKAIAVEPANSAVISGGFIPKNYNPEVVDQVFPVKDDEAMKASRLLAQKEGLLVGISSGAALHAAISLAQKEENAGKTIVVLLPDTGERYLSTELFAYEDYPL